MGVNNRDLGTVTRLETGQITVQMDGKIERTIQFDPARMRHFDHGYAITSHVSQGLTEGRVIANMDTDSSRSLINTRLAYVAVSRAEHDARIYTNDAEGLGARLATDISKTSAVDFRRAPEPAPQKATGAQVREYADPNHRIAAVVLAYAEHPYNTVVIAKDPAERRELNQLIRADLQASGTVAPDSKSLPVHVEKELTNPKLAAQYASGDIIQYRQGSPASQGIPNDSAAVVVSTETRYRAELNIKLPGLDTMTADEVKKTIDTVITDPATASAVESKTIKLGMSPDEVKKSLGNPDKIVDLGPKQVYIYKDMKVVFLNSQVSDVQ